MRYFNLKGDSKDLVLCNLNGNEPKYMFEKDELTPAINKLRVRIEGALLSRNYDVPGIEVNFYHNVNDKGQHIIKVSNIRCTDPTISPDVEIWNTSVRTEGFDFSYYSDGSGSLTVYCGDDWKSDRKEFLCRKGHHEKMENRKKSVLKYSCHGYGNNTTFVSDNDCNRVYSPDQSKGEPLEYSLNTIERTILKGLKRLSDYIETFDVAVPDGSIFKEPDPIFLTNPIFAGATFHTTAQDYADNKDKGNFGMDCGWRLLPLSLNGPKDHPYHKLMNEGFIYCNIEWADERGLQKNNWHYAGMGSIKNVVVIPQKVNNVFVVDQKAMENYRDAWFKENPTLDRMTNEAYNQADVMRASTMVHINDYQGNFDMPVVIIGRILTKKEIVILGDSADDI